MTSRNGVAVLVRGLRKSYGDLEAVAGVDLEIREGEVFAILGPNGAGKTTTVEILEGYRQRDAGEVSVLGLDPGHQRGQLKARVGIVLQSTGMEPYLTVRETIAMYASFYPHPRPVDETIELVGLSAKSNDRVVRLSGGQQRRLDVAVALAGDPELLFLDEPTTGFDPAARREAWEVIRNLASLGKTVVLTTHYMDEAQYLANRVAVIARGRVIAEGPPSTLGERYRDQVRIRYRVREGFSAPESAAGTLRPDGFVELFVDEPDRVLYELLAWSLQNDHAVQGLEVARPSLEDVYLTLTEDDVDASSPDPRREP